MMDRIEQFRQSFYQRNVEKNDTRQAIQRHDPEFHKKKNDEGDSHEHKDPYDDLTDVSVSALISFLEGLLETKRQYQPETIETKHGEQTSKISDDDNKAEPVDRYRQQAVAAYQTRKQSIEPERPKAPASSAGNQASSAVDQAALALDEVEILTTLRGLHDLENRNITHISLARGDGFLQTIQNAIAKA